MCDLEHPASCLVHWPSGPVAACDKHANGLVALAKFMGGHVVATKLTEPAQCSNCVNEAKQDAPENQG